jgi:hypothetical protein
VTTTGNVPREDHEDHEDDTESFAVFVVFAWRVVVAHTLSVFHLPCANRHVVTIARR